MSAHSGMVKHQNGTGVILRYIYNILCQRCLQTQDVVVAQNGRGIGLAHALYHRYMMTMLKHMLLALLMTGCQTTIDLNAPFGDTTTDTGEEECPTTGGETTLSTSTTGSSGVDSSGGDSTTGGTTGSSTGGSETGSMCMLEGPIFYLNPDQVAFEDDCNDEVPNLIGCDITGNGPITITCEFTCETVAHTFEIPTGSFQLEFENPC